MLRRVTFLLALLLVGVAGIAYAQLGQPSNMNVAAAVSAPDFGGKIAYARNGALWILSGGSATQLTHGPEDKQDKRDAQPSFSPDGSSLAYVRLDEGFSDIFKLRISNPTHPQALTDHRPKAETGGSGYVQQALWALQPAWSPDGLTLAYTSDVGTEYPGLFLMDASGTNERRIERLDHSTQAVEHATWSPDGTRIAVATYVTKGAKGQIWILRLDTGSWIEVTDSKDGAYDPAWSPDGATLAFTMRDGTAHNIYLAPTDTSSWTGDHAPTVQLTTDGASRSPVWSPDGTHLAYLSLKANSFDVYAGELKAAANGAPILASIARLTEDAHIDATSGLTWAK